MSPKNLSIDSVVRHLNISRFQNLFLFRTKKHRKHYKSIHYLTSTHVAHRSEFSGFPWHPAIAWCYGQQGVVRTDGLDPPLRSFRTIEKAKKKRLVLLGIWSFKQTHLDTKICLLKLLLLIMMLVHCWCCMKLMTMIYCRCEHCQAV